MFGKRRKQQHIEHRVYSAGAAIAVPLWQRIRASHPDNRYRLMLSLGRAF